MNKFYGIPLVFSIVMTLIPSIYAFISGRTVSFIDIIQVFGVLLLLSTAISIAFTCYYDIAREFFRTSWTGKLFLTILLLTFLFRSITQFRLLN